MRVLYHQPLCPFSRKIRLLLSEKKLDYTLKIEPFWEKREELFELNHALQVPVLVDLNGINIAESHAIEEYIEEIYTEPPLIGEDPIQKAEVRRLVCWFDIKFAREVSLPIVEERFFNQFKKNKPLNSNRLRDAKTNINIHLEYIGWLIARRSWLAGDDFSLADIAAASHLSVIDYFGAVPWEDNEDAKNWYMRIKSRPTFRSLLADKIPNHKPSKHYNLLDW